MSPLFNKLNLGDHRLIHVLNAPPSFDAELALLAGDLEVRKALPAVPQQPLFAIAFAVKQAELDAASAQLVAAAGGDAVVWIAYAKGTSRKFKSEFNRDSGWTVLAAGGFEPVRQVAIDDDWSALRFRRAAYVKSLTRDASRALSAEGKRRTAQKK